MFNYHFAVLFAILCQILTMPETTELSKRKAAAQAWLTRVSKNCEKAVEEIDGLSQEEYDDLISNFNEKLSKWQELQSEFELTLDIDDMADAIDKASQFRDNSRSSYLKLQSKWAKQCAPAITDDSASISSANESRSIPFKMKLPALNLPKFDGNIMDFTNFWQQFEACVDRSDYPTISKFNYLMSILQGEARHIPYFITYKAYF